MEPELVFPERFTDPRLGADLLWRDVRIERFLAPAPALFLDRDGVIVEEKLYLSNPDDIELLPGVHELICGAHELGMAVVEITNQAGIAHGYFGWPEFVRVENELANMLSEQGVEADAVFACPFHPQGRTPYRHENHPWRKPNPGMILEAARLLNLALDRSVLIGDKVSDLEAGRAAGLLLGVHVLTGHGREHEAASRAVASARFPVTVVACAHEAVRLLPGYASRHF